MNRAAPCPCCSGRSYGECCESFHRGETLPPTPEALMRSRYSAFALGQVDHLWRTLHPLHEDQAHKPADVKRSLKRMCNRSTFPKLTILSTEPVDGTGAAHVTFHAVIMDHGVDVGFVERSEFRQDQGAWKYVRGDMQRKPAA